MRKKLSHIYKNVQKYHFEIKHLSVLLVVLVFFMTIVSFINKTSIQNLLIRTQQWYQQDSAERLANLTATSLELLLETNLRRKYESEQEKMEIIKALNVVINQQKLQQHVLDVSLIIPVADSAIVINNGNALFTFFYENKIPPTDIVYEDIKSIYLKKIFPQHRMQESTVSLRDDDGTFHVFIPFVPRGEYMGSIYMKNKPDFSFITDEIITSFDETALLFAAMIILGLLAMFYISSYTVRERDEALQELYEERERRLLEKIEREKEELFTKRIYHTHHKAEKIMGFIKEDLRKLNAENLNETKDKIVRYANFISRVIYDMKWYDPPLNTVRNPMFNSDINQIIRFIVNHIFLRTSKGIRTKFNLKLNDSFPKLKINEFVIWEILEPLIQNCIEHNASDSPVINIITQYNPEAKEGKIIIEDNGKGIVEELLEEENGIKKLFMEHVTTKKDFRNSGYGCYIAYEIASKRCGWMIDADNWSSLGGARFIISFAV